jgi:hypothetical protein
VEIFYPIFVLSAGRQIFIGWCPWLDLARWIVRRLQAQGWNASTYAFPSNPRGNPLRPPFSPSPYPGERNDLTRPWYVACWLYPSGQKQLLLWCGTEPMAAWAGRELVRAGGGDVSVHPFSPAYSYPPYPIG